MKTSNFIQIGETEKALQFEVGFRRYDSAPGRVFGKEGTQTYEYAYPVTCWVPKSAISEDGTIAEWFVKKIYAAFGTRFNPFDSILYNF